MLLTTLIAAEEAPPWYNVPVCSINCCRTFRVFEFAALVKKHQAERVAKGFDVEPIPSPCCFAIGAIADSRAGLQRLELLYGQVGALALPRSQQVHLVVRQRHRPARSTRVALLRPWRASAPSNNCEPAHVPFQNELLRSIHTFALLSLFLGRSSAHQGGVKAHVLMDMRILPRYVLLHPRPRLGVRRRHQFDLAAGIHRGRRSRYNDFRLLTRWIQAGSTSSFAPCTTWSTK